MDEHRCTNCGASLPLTGTYCLACDTPVADAVRGLSVGETQVVRRGRPIVAAAILVAVVVVVGALFFGVRHLVEGRADAAASAAAKKGVEVVVSAEGGHSGACPTASIALAGTPGGERAACQAVVGDDPGAHLDHLHATSVSRHGDEATVDLRGTLVDRSGKRVFDRSVSLVERDGSWLLDWDGSAITTP